MSAISTAVSQQPEIHQPRQRTEQLKTTSTSHEDEPITFEFGGAPGVALLMIGFPLLMYYMYIGATFYDGQLPLPRPGESLAGFGSHLLDLAYTHAFPHRKAWVIYWTFLVLEGLGYLYLPGVYGKGKCLPHLNGKQLDYYCSAAASWYVTIVAALVLHFTELFPLTTLITEFGPLMSVAICSGFLVSIVAYASALMRGCQHRMTGSHVYDFFMGAELNPRLFRWIDMKMFFEVRIPWYILFLLTLGTALKQWEELGFVSGEVAFLLMAHFLYANACAKGEELIITSWDMYYEKWGFMLIFWNLAGVPMSYCHCTLYLANHDPSTYRWNPAIVAAWAILYLFMYWVWDTCNSQKNIFRAQERGVSVTRRTFPQLPWRAVKNPKSIATKTGDSILCSGWYGMARKVHYTCDWFFAFSWGLITGFKSPFPWFYSIFFTVMIIHRARRDIERCRERYGEAWREYERRVPYLFIPYVF
ncbi:Delta(24(24(1)))-sterol reductase [Aspergillus indologenus CBS 114.80]|uniref:Delta(24(24(1)))-sterol reductase n=1 Tax=Aspergillus indologenus CBS 114.80 TaxID=1450541 RepID=A0A2V5HN72_9EURO|nr:Delta(24(24(1)))-sterol reductase [Aspergillus indologenus CBS 114.80]